MFGHDADLQPLPVERAAGLTQSTDDGERFTDVIDPDPAVLQLEKRSLLACHRGTVSEGLLMQSCWATRSTATAMF